MSGGQRRPPRAPGGAGAHAACAAPLPWTRGRQGPGCSRTRARRGGRKANVSRILSACLGHPECGTQAQAGPPPPARLGCPLAPGQGRDHNGERVCLKRPRHCLTLAAADRSGQTREADRPAEATGRAGAGRAAQPGPTRKAPPRRAPRGGPGAAHGQARRGLGHRQSPEAELPRTQGPERERRAWDSSVEPSRAKRPEAAGAGQRPQQRDRGRTHRSLGETQAPYNRSGRPRGPSGRGGGRSRPLWLRTAPRSRPQPHRSQNHGGAGQGV